MTISGKGKPAEERFCELTGAIPMPTTRKAEGDALIDGIPVEVKGASSNTLNQVRAVKYITLIVYDEGDHTWYVVPAHDVVRLAAGKKRGQHTENPFESVTLSIKRLQELSLRVMSEDALLTRVRAAIEAAKLFPRLQAAMREVLAKSQRLSDESKQEVQRVLQEYNLCD
ncbi:hypothetical protein [Nannocystis sp.]|uniref:hypothetical protein n=1 Tax=Nannocystis sp. TaxID=1962667 RepID=UPI0025F46E22|nr:hypothetical protein [Nannocystis sp.]MBK7829255.1 hypothetical protein [Nannocystis sp.]